MATMIWYNDSIISIFFSWLVCFVVVVVVVVLLFVCFGRVLNHVYPALFLSQIVTTERLLCP